MTTATFVPTTKSVLLPLVVLVFVLVAQVCSNNSNPQVVKWQPNLKEKDNLAAIEAFRKFVDKSELRSITRVTMKDNNVVDEVRLDPTRCAKRVLCVAVKALTNAKFFGNLRAKLRANFIQDYTELVRLFNDFKLLPSPLNIDSNYDDISRMHNEFYDGTCPLNKYYEKNRIKREEKKIKKFFFQGGSAVGSKNYPTQVMRLANFFVPLAQRVIEVYDEAIDYIIQQYETECIDKRSKVQQYPKYYLMVLWSIFMPHTQFENEFNAFIATACPIVPLTIDGQHSVKICDMRHEGGVVNVKREKKLQISNKVSDLWKYLEMVKGTTTRGGLLAKLMTNFTEYYNEKVEKKRKAHDDNLWIGYQKKLIVQQTVLREMEEDFKTAEAVLKDQKDKLLKVLPNGQIPDNIVTEVHSALLGSAKYRTLCTNEWTTKGEAILTSVLMLVYQANVQFELNSADCTTDPERDKRIVNILPAEMQMFLPNHKGIYRGVAYEALVDSAVGLLEKHSLVDKFEQFAQQWQENERNMIMTQMMFTVDADVMALLIGPNSSSDSVILPPPSIETIHEQKCRKGWCVCGVVALLIVGGTIWKLWNNDNNDTDALSPEPISNSTDQSIIDGHPSINVIVIVVTVIYALFALCALFCLIRRYRNLNKKKNMKANKKKNKSPNSPEQSSALFPSTAPSSSVASGISSCAGSSASALSISSTSPSSVDTIDGQPWYRNGTQKLNIWIAIGILVLTGGSIVAYCFLGSNSSSTTMTIVGVVALIIMTILLVGSGVLYLIYRGKGRTISQSEHEQRSKKKPTACTGSAVGDESILCGTSSAASSAASLSVVVPSSVTSSVSDASTLHRADSSTVVSVVASNNKRSPAKGGNKASKSPLPTRTKSPTPPKGPSTSTSTRKAYTSAFPSSSVLTTTTTNSTCSPKMKLPSLANKPLARKSLLKGPSLPTRVKSPTGKGTTNPQNGNPKGAQKKDSK